MAMQDMAAALQRFKSVLERRPAFGLGEDSSASARWDGGMRCVTTGPHQHQVVTDMPREIGGGGAEVTPGWLMRAGLASCLATRIAMAAALDGIELDSLEVSAGSRSDDCGLFGMTAANGQLVTAGPQEVQLRVRIAAAGVTAERLRALVESSHRLSPVACALRDTVPMVLQLELD
jgi:uncharacterized OsmC-like protein